MPIAMDRDPRYGELEADRDMAMLSVLQRLSVNKTEVFGDRYLLSGQATIDQID